MDQRGGGGRLGLGARIGFFISNYAVYVPLHCPYLGTYAFSPWRKESTCLLHKVLLDATFEKAVDAITSLDIHHHYTRLQRHSASQSRGHYGLILLAT